MTIYYGSSRICYENTLDKFVCTKQTPFTNQRASIVFAIHPDRKESIDFVMGVRRFIFTCPNCGLCWDEYPDWHHD